jgi:uncharacterized protein YuzE
MAEIEVKMPIDAFRVIRNALERTKRKIKEKIIGLSYDEHADVLYVRFKQSKIVDSRPLDENGMVIASLDKNGRIVGVIVMDASEYQ